jgi:V-type H+-transporting ATPase subunit E
LINRSRTQKLIAKNKAILKLLNHTQLIMIERIKDKKVYSKILQDIIVESLVKLMEPKVFIRCLKKDVDTVKGVISACVKQYKQILKDELNQDAELDLTVDEAYCLEERVIPDFQNLKFEEFTDDHERQIKIDRSNDSKKW